MVSPRQIRKLVSETPQSDIFCQLSRARSHDIEIVRKYEGMHLESTEGKRIRAGRKANVALA